MKNRTIYALLITLCVIGFWLFENFYTPATYSNPNGAKGDLVHTDFLPYSTTGEVVQHAYYTLSYSEPHEQAEWVAYTLKREHLTYEDRERPYFIEDPKVKTKSADWWNYRGSGYDRGHLLPAGDRRFSEQAYNETFYTSNISPQNKYFNAGIWNRLEQKVRYWCKKYGDLIVVTGGVLENGLEEIGSEDIDVPNSFYKIVLKGNGGGAQVLAFLIPAEESQEPLQNFVVPVDEIEEKTGIDFFQNQPENWQSAMEARVDTQDWKF
ncbi:DNA/RNA non-specific endonuclease [Flagellimonas halotolerans]|uniref:Endonuclease n=1 Tax=Flagellimonas halotolerans TaxID=3112164 RepID=A0ABU6INR0_9FLAO|nr:MULTISPECIES: DNA/RNA non-specific endonuclease [unclassified Allomuricauda]MEC3964962.1 DNA/RNA non-specific endonuclease [Muricauda sp. SYSU M86414]MEC4264676.1 DNA/RNA non-specific endonuclease [Muricauda sp. SYSU M84420]